MENNRIPLKLYLGCGSNVKEGYLNVDQYVFAPSVINIDIFNLPIENNTVDEIFTEHMLEHLSKYEVPQALKEWARVLKLDGKLVMNLPNLEWCLHQWLAKPEEDRWGWQLDTIFGLQTHPGEFHKTGFTKPRLHQLLTEAGFKEIRISDYWSHGQSCFWIEATKSMKLDSNELRASGYLASVIVPWWDHTELLEQWERNLIHLPNTEIIFIDNGSDLAGKAALEFFCSRHDIKLIRNEENRGFAAANNQGLEVATGEYILHLNNDIEILSSPINYLYSCAANSIAGPGPTQNEIGEIYIEGWALWIKKSILQALGGWCEDYGPGYWDDVDLCLRAKLAGYLLTSTPHINNLIHHKANATGRDGRLNQIALHIRNRGIFLNKHYSICPKFIVDGVFFQLYSTGIARVWHSLLTEWADNGFAKYIVVLDRAGTAPAIAGIRYRPVPAYDYGRTDTDREMLQQICEEEGADLFISSYYTTPLATPSVFLVHDMIPELMKWDLNHPMWREKHYAIQHASTYIAVSENTARDLNKVFPNISLKSITIAQNGINHQLFAPARAENISQFKTKYGISKPYFILVGSGGYKNTILFFKTFAQLHTKQGFEIVCTGSGWSLETELRTYTSGSVVHMLQLSDEELIAAYSGAIALVYPSKYEGFGLPVLEAIACGCPVITCPNASIPEVAGEAALYINDQDIDELADALCEVQKPKVRNSLIAAGLEQAKKFSWSRMAKTVSSALIDTTLLPLNLRDINLIIFPDWSQPEESLCLELEQVIKAIASLSLTTNATRPDSSQITLLVDSGDTSEEEAALILSSVSMNLLMQEDLDISEGLEISLIGQLSEIQWEALLPRIQSRIVLENEDQEAIALFKAVNIPSRKLDEYC